MAPHNSWRARYYIKLRECIFIFRSDSCSTVSLFSFPFFIVGCFFCDVGGKIFQSNHCWKVKSPYRRSEWCLPRAFLHQWLSRSKLCCLDADYSLRHLFYITKITIGDGYNVTAQKFFLVLTVITLSYLIMSYKTPVSFISIRNLRQNKNS